jgi:protein-disulfide isomerase
MAYESTGTNSITVREEAREKARQIREQQKKLEKRNRRLVRGIVFFGTIALIGIIAIVLTSTIRPPSAGPLNMLSDGILIGESFHGLETSAIQPGHNPIPNLRDDASDVVAIEIYVDYFSPLGLAFEEANGEQISTWVDSGAVTLEVHPLAILDRVSQGTKYSTRAANAAACVANFAPDQFYDFHVGLLKAQPAEDSAGLTDKQLVQLTLDANVNSTTKIRGCIEAQTFRSWVADARARALTGPIPSSDVSAITDTPTVIVNGVQYDGAPNDAVAFSAFVVQAAGTSFNENATPTPTPTATPAP